jgi:hypothetical protein
VELPHAQLKLVMHRTHISQPVPIHSLTNYRLLTQNWIPKYSEHRWDCNTVCNKLEVSTSPLITSYKHNKVMSWTKKDAENFTSVVVLQVPCNV